MPELDHPFPLIEVVVQKLSKEDRAVLATRERKPANNQTLMLARVASSMW